jgi:hypothetical protein
MEYIGCKHLDYSDNYRDCKIIHTDFGQYWLREKGYYSGGPIRVQFCKKKGRINGVGQCLFEGLKPCFEKQTKKEDK